jgi:DNA-binding response OmpR family regulator
MGGDDYIIKPFKLNELLSRIKALLRRTNAFRQNETMLTAGDLCIDIMQNRVTKAGIELELTAGEYRLLCYFVRNKGVLLSREKIEDTLWDQKGAYVDDNTLSVYIRRLRNKLEIDPSHPQLLQTVRGIGYRFISSAD